jgi:hypothetical protein
LSAYLIDKLIFELTGEISNFKWFLNIIRKGICVRFTPFKGKYEIFFQKSNQEEKF